MVGLSESRWRPIFSPKSRDFNLCRAVVTLPMRCIAASPIYGHTREMSPHAVKKFPVVEQHGVMDTIVMFLLFRKDEYVV
ncbi:hypothetical protein Sjap_011129 [Stephania japonica]|uniref:Uncharacterized protein n=1 Tax=Stephania japonica TaxID=461633 RepID=A0AAP0P4F3_9MAGN